MSKLVVVIQCDIVTKRCSGYACMNTFVNRKDTLPIIRLIRASS